MNIAFYIHQFPSLSETFILNQVTGLLDRGHDVTVFANRTSDDPVKHDIVEEYALQERTEVVDFPDSVGDGIKTTARSIPRLLQHPSTLGEARRTIRKGRLAPAYLSSLRKYVNHNQQFDIHHAHFGTIGRQWEFLSRQSEVPFVTTFYGFDVSRYVHPDNYDIYQRFWDAPDLCLGLTHHIRSKMLLLGCPERKAMKHPIGIDPDRFEAEVKPQASGGPLRIVSVARLTEKKGIGYALDAIAQCQDDGIDIRYRIAGDGELRDALERQVRQYGIGDAVTFCGWATQSEVLELLSWGDLFLLPSVTARDGDMEGQALVLQEAQAKGLPVISTYHDGIPEGVDESHTAELVPERDIKGLKQAISHFTDPNRLRSYSRKAQQFVRERFDNKDLLDRQEAIYEHLVAGGDGRIDDSMTKD
jgi:colanic acid/amylovoran biosynthesis glycosyltransferase